MVTIQLSPQELGSVRISIAHLGTATTVNVTVERPETLALVQADSQHLHEALDRAGIGGEGREIQFQLAEPQVAAPTGGSGWRCLGRWRWRGEPADPRAGGPAGAPGRAGDLGGADRDAAACARDCTWRGRRDRVKMNGETLQ